MRKTIFALVASATCFATTPASAQIYVQPGSDTPGVVECGMADSHGDVNCSFRQTSDPFEVTDTQIAGCVDVVFTKNRITERDARRLRAGTAITVLGESQALEAGDTVWEACGAHLRQREILARNEELCRRYSSLMERLRQLDETLGEARRVRATADFLSTAISWLIPG